MRLLPSLLLLGVIGAVLLYGIKELDDDQTYRYVEIGGQRLLIGRTPSGVADIAGETLNDLARGVGYMHAHDRFTQMEMMRLACRGMLSEKLDGTSDLLLRVDRTFRKLNFVKHAEESVKLMDKKTRAYYEAYAEGVNTFMLETNPSGNPLAPGGVRYDSELRLVGHTAISLWTPVDSQMIGYLMSYDLGSKQGDMEKIIMLSLRQEGAQKTISRLFTPHLEKMPKDIGEILRSTHIERTLPENLALVTLIPSASIGSNNWAVSGEHTATGSAFQANDPHLEVTRLPGFWYEIRAACTSPQEMHYYGASLPGQPGVMMGRNSHLSYGITYGFMDQVDYWVMNVKDQKYLLDGKWLEFETRTMNLTRKGASNYEFTIFENQHGHLEVSEEIETSGVIPDGYYLLMGFSASKFPSASTLQSIHALQTAKTVKDGMKAAKGVLMSCNFVLADDQGNIGYQQTGNQPNRKGSGLYPLYGWNSDNYWSGLHQNSAKTSMYNPAEGYIVTANDNWQNPEKGSPVSINLHMNPNRAQRIKDLFNEAIQSGRKLTIDDMKAAQCDIYSRTAKHVVATLKKYIPKSSPRGKALLNWDFKFSMDSKAAVVFEDMLEFMKERVFAKHIFGEEAYQWIQSNQLLLKIYEWIITRTLFDMEPEKDHFNRVLGPYTTKENAYSTVKAFFSTDINANATETLRTRRKNSMNNIFFNGALPTWVGVDYNNPPMPGTFDSPRAIMHLVKPDGKVIISGQSYRYVTDMGSMETHSSLPGGASGRPFSQFYTNQVKTWHSCGFETTRMESAEKHAPKPEGKTEV